MMKTQNKIKRTQQPSSCYIVGIDEVGRGAWAGPLLVAGVRMPTHITIDGLTDSKMLSRQQRAKLLPNIFYHSNDVLLCWYSAKDIDRHGLSRCLKDAVRRIISEISKPDDRIIVDGTMTFEDVSTNVESLIKADLLIPAVSAASIVAKQRRDNYMSAMSRYYPDYGFESHVGYGTVAHRKSIAKNGLTSLHRLSFRPLSQFIDD